MNKTLKRTLNNKVYDKDDVHICIEDLLESFKEKYLATGEKEKVEAVDEILKEILE